MQQADFLDRKSAAFYFPRLTSSSHRNDTCAASSDMQQSFNWTPGIGDPTFVGWLTVALYFAAATNCWITAREIASATSCHRHEERSWRFIAILFLALGINKQLDLQTALTEVGRMIAHAQGWYDQRRSVQVAFIAVVAFICLATAIALLISMRRAPAPTWLALTGTGLVLAFVLIRAASFHHIDRFIGERILGLRWNWVIEISGISLVLIASQWRRAKWIA